MRRSSFSSGLVAAGRTLTGLLATALALLQLAAMPASATTRHRVLRVARTVADLEHHEQVTRADVLTALAMRQRGGGGSPAAMAA